MEYQIVRANSSEILETKVNLLMSKGWQVQGGIGVIMGRLDKPEFYQAMVFIPQH